MFNLACFQDLPRARNVLAGRDPLLLEAIEKKIPYIPTFQEHNKHLQEIVKGLRRVHFGSYARIHRFKDCAMELISLDHPEDAH